MQVKKTLILTVVLMIFISWINLAKAQKSVHLTGSVQDSTNSEPLIGATVAFKLIGSSVHNLLTFTAAGGNFDVSLKDDSLKGVVISYLGYNNKSLALSIALDKDTAINLGIFKLVSSKNHLLKEVNISGTKPIVKQEIDRISYNVQLDPDKKVVSTLDILRKVPLISLDAQEHVLLKGSGSYKILINGRPSSLFSNDPATILKSIPANSIQKIEVITTPPSKYDSEGLVGLLNIVMVKKAIDGYDVSLGASENVPYGPLASADATIKKNKFTSSFFASYHNQSQPQTSGKNTISYLYPVQGILNQTSENKFSGNFYLVNGEMSYEKDSLQLFTMSLSYNNYSFNSFSKFLSETLNPSNQLVQRYELSDYGRPKWDGIDVGFNYQQGFPDNKDKLLTVSYRFDNSRNDISDLVDFTNSQNFNQQDFRQVNNFGFNENTLQLDYVNPKKVVTVEAGGKTIFRNNYSNFLTTTSSYNVDSLTNNFNFQQNVYSVYNSYYIKFKSWSIKGGGRIEDTRVSESLMKDNFSNDYSYLKIIPAFSIQINQQNGSYNIGYTQRIQRPNISELNPFTDQSNPLIIRSGNPNLKAVLANNFEMSYSNFSKGSYYVGLSYTFTNNDIQRVTSLTADSVSKSTYQNIGQNKTGSLFLSTSNLFFKKLRLNFNGSISYVWLRGAYNTINYINGGFQGQAGMFINYVLPKNFRIGSNLNFNSSSFQLQGKTSAYPYTSFNISKQFLKNHLSAFFSINNPFSKFINVKSYVNTKQIYQTISSQNYYRTAVFSLNYSFGGLDSSTKKVKHDLKNDDLKPLERKINL